MCDGLASVQKRWTTIHELPVLNRAARRLTTGANSGQKPDPGDGDNQESKTMKITVQKIPNKGRFAEYPALKNVRTGQVYVDTTLGQTRFLEFGEDGLNRCGEFVGFNPPGAWTTWNGQEPECPIKREISFELADDPARPMTFAEFKAFAGESARYCYRS